VQSSEVEGSGGRAEEGSGGTSLEAIAIAVTALLGIVSYVIQARAAAQSERSQVCSHSVQRQIFAVQQRYD
jgi:hypothetical protein